jgi:hypothetical protein
VPENHSAAGEIVRRDLDSDAIAAQAADPVPLHPAGSIGEQFVAVVEPHAKPTLRQDLEDHALGFDQVFL